MEDTYTQTAQFGHEGSHVNSLCWIDLEDIWRRGRDSLIAADASYDESYTETIIPCV